MVILYTCQLTKNPQKLTLGWILECRWARYCWWFRNPANHLGCIKTLKNNGIFTMPYLTGAGFIPSTVSMEDSSFLRKCLRSFRVPSRHRCEFSVGSTGAERVSFSWSQVYVWCYKVFMNTWCYYKTPVDSSATICIYIYIQTTVIVRIRYRCSFCPTTFWRRFHCRSWEVLGPTGLETCSRHHVNVVLQKIVFFLGGSSISPSKAWDVHANKP